MMLESDPDRFVSSLKGKRVIIGITASISIYRVPDIIRDLRREGAEVIAGMSREACEMVSPEVFKWATGNPVITNITGHIEHVSLFEERPGDTMLLVCPASYNFIGKAASGISDDVPSLFFSFALGNGNPIVVSPVMHEGMMVNPINKENLAKLEQLGVSIVPPRVESGKAKISEPDKIIDCVSRSFTGGLLSGKNILVIGGRGEESIDPVRKITNSGTGVTASWLIRNSFRLGAEKLVFIGNSSMGIPDYATHKEAASFAEFRKATEETLQNHDFDLVVNVASLPDFSVENKFTEKIDSSMPMELRLKPQEKLNNLIRAQHRGTLVVFKLSEKKNIEETRKNFEKCEPEIIVFNSYSNKVMPFGTVMNDYTAIKKDKVIEMGKLSKPEMTLSLLKMAKDLTS